MARFEDIISDSYWPEDTNTLAKIYQVCKDNDILMLQNHLWNYKEPELREIRAQEIILAVWEVLNESCF